MSIGLSCVYAIVLLIGFFFGFHLGAKWMYNRSLAAFDRHIARILQMVDEQNAEFVNKAKSLIQN